ncbi:MAG: hypothetical protein PHE51_10470 [Eubacteriales bacterium]|nr:hypothetical protein [Eubacteriales bacterium]
MTQSIVRSKKAINFFALFPIIMTILSPYSLTDGGGVYICDVLLVLMALYLLTAKSIIFYKPLFALLAIDCLLTLLAFLFTESSNTNLLLAAKVAVVFTLYLFVYSKIWSCDIKESFLRVAELIGIICAALAILQFIFASMGFNFYDGKLFLPLGEGSYFGGLFDRNTKDLRVHSFFEEPSYLAFF